MTRASVSRVTCTLVLRLYDNWLAKEELPNKKFNSLLNLTERLGQVDMKLFQHRSGGAGRETFLLLGKMVKSDVVEEIRQANPFGLLTDEVCERGTACNIHQICGC